MFCTRCSFGLDCWRPPPRRPVTFLHLRALSPRASSKRLPFPLSRLRPRPARRPEGPSLLHSRTLSPSMCSSLPDHRRVFTVPDYEPLRAGAICYFFCTPSAWVASWWARWDGVAGTRAKRQIPPLCLWVRISCIISILFVLHNREVIVILLWGVETLKLKEFEGFKCLAWAAELEWWFCFVLFFLLQV